MSRGKVFILPGILGSCLQYVDNQEVRYGRPVSGVIWPNRWSVFAGSLGMLAFAVGGTTPANPRYSISLSSYGSSDTDYNANLAGGPYVQSDRAWLSAYYDRAYNQLTADGWEAYDLAYDWRYDPQVCATNCLNRINSILGNSTDPFYLVGHSMGGLVARLIYQQLAAAGQQARVQRIVTLGTPNWGSWSLVLAAGHLGETFQRVAAWYGNLTRPLGGGQAALDNILWTWPSMYALLPSRYEPGAGTNGQPGGANWWLYTHLPSTNAPYFSASNPAVNWQGLDASAATQLLLSQASSQPPATVLVAVAGVNYRTPWYGKHLVTGASLEPLSSMNEYLWTMRPGDTGIFQPPDAAPHYADGGDNNVILSNAMLPAQKAAMDASPHGSSNDVANQYVLACSHDQLVNIASVPLRSLDGVCLLTWYLTNQYGIDTNFTGVGGSFDTIAAGHERPRTPQERLTLIPPLEPAPPDRPRTTEPSWCPGAVARYGR